MEIFACHLIVTIPIQAENCILSICLLIVDDRGEHAHVIGGVAVHPAFAGGGSTPPDVAAANHDGELEGGREDIADLVGEATRDRLGEVIAGFGQSFPGKF